MTIDIQEDVLESLKSTLERADFKSATQIIIDNNIEPNSNISNKENILTFAINSSDADNQEDLNNFIIELHNRGMDLDESKNNEITPLLFTAISYSNPKLTEMLLSTNSYSKEDAVLSLHLVCDGLVDFKTFLPVFSKFSEYVDEKNIYGDSVISNIAGKNYKGVENKLFSLLRASEDKESINFKGQNTLFQAVETGTAYTTKLLLGVNINVNHLDKYERNALFRVDGESEDDVKTKLRYLVEAGINTEQLNKSNKSAFDVNDKITPYRDWVKTIKDEMNQPKDVFETIISESTQRKRNSMR